MRPRGPLRVAAGLCLLAAAAAAAQPRVEAVPAEAVPRTPSAAVPAASVLAAPAALPPALPAGVPAAPLLAAPAPAAASAVPAAAPLAAPARNAVPARTAGPSQAPALSAAPAAASAVLEPPARGRAAATAGPSPAASPSGGSEFWDGAHARPAADADAAAPASVAAASRPAARLDPAQASLIKNHQTFTRGRGFADYVRIFDGNFGAGAFSRSVAALKGRSDARWLDSGGGEGVATAQLMETPGYEGLTTTLVSFETSARPGPRRRVLSGRFLQDIPHSELGRNHLVTDVIGVLAYTYDFMSDFRKLYRSLAPDGELFLYLGSSQRDFFGGENKVVAGGKVLPLGEYLKTIPGLEYELIKTPLYDKSGGDRIGEVWNARVRRSAGAEPRWPELETIYFKEGDRAQGEIVPRRMFRVKGEPAPSPAVLDALAAEAGAARAAAVAERGAEALFDSFRGYSGLNNPLLNRLIQLRGGRAWAVEGPSAERVARDVREGFRFTDRAYFGPAQWLLSLIARDAVRRPLVAPGAKPAVLVVDGLSPSYRFGEDLERWVAAVPDGGEVWVSLGPLKGGSGAAARVLRRDGRRGDLYDWVATIPGLEASFSFGHRFDGRVHAEPAWIRIVVPDHSEVRIPRLETLGAGAPAADGVPVAYYREAPEARAARVERALKGGVATAAARGPGGETLATASFALKAGVLSADARPGARAAGLDPEAELGRALATFGAGVRAVAAEWSGAGRAEFNAGLAAGATPEEAALKTWAGRAASAAGLTRVLFDAPSRGKLAAQAPASRSALTALFVRPEDAVADRDGRVWRRAEVRKGDGGTWERYESDGREAWLRRYDAPAESGAYEYESRRPRDGAPAKRYAVFSVRDGAFSFFTSAGGSGLIDPRAEFRRALARLAPGVRSIEARWSSGNGLAEFKRRLLRGEDPADAARATWSGRLAVEAGFTEVRFAPGALEDLRAARRGEERGLVATFVRP